MSNIDFNDRRFVDDEWSFLATPEDLYGLHPWDGHKAVPVAANGWAAPVDESIAEVVYLAWRLGLGTRSSCQAYKLKSAVEWLPQGTVAGIHFVDMDECRRFVGLLHDVGFDTEMFLRVGAWIEGGKVSGEVDFLLEIVPELASSLRRALGEE